MSQDYKLSLSDSEKINITTYGDIQNRCIVYVHGFKGFKNWGFVPYISQYLSEKGFFVITFNFSLNGVGDNLYEFDELEKFAKNTYTREISELSEIVSVYRKNYFGPQPNKGIGLLGHSRGGGIALLTASKLKSVSAVATWASVSTFDRYSERQKKEWRKNGYFEALNSRTNQLMRMNSEFLDDIEINSGESLNLKKAVQNLNKPLFLAHGEQDLAVPVKECKKLFEWSDHKQTELFLLQTTGHTFDAKHPFEGTNDNLEKLLSKTAQFFEKHL